MFSFSFFFLVDEGNYYKRAIIDPPVKHYLNGVDIIPDKFKPFVIQTLHKELAPILQLIFQRSKDTGKIPDI